MANKKEPTVAKTDLYSGVEAQHDSFNGVPGNSILDVENDLLSFEGVPEDVDKYPYDNYIFVGKKELGEFCRMVDPLTKSQNNEYGKSIYIHSINTEWVELQYNSAPFNLRMKVPNYSGKTIGDLFLRISVFKKLLTNGFSSIVIVEEENGFSLSIGSGLIYLDTVSLKTVNYGQVKKTVEKQFDLEVGQYVFKKLGPILKTVIRSDEANIVIKDGHAYFNTGSFVSKVKSPFVEGDDFIIFLACSEILASFCEMAKGEVRYSLIEDKDLLVLYNKEGGIYIEMIYGKNVKDFYSPMVERTLNFQPDVVLVNDSIRNLLKVVQNMDYLSNIIEIEFTKSEMLITTYSQDMEKSNKHSFQISEGRPLVLGEMRAFVNVVRSYFELTGDDVYYTFTEDGLGIKNDQGIYLIRKNQ